jgi:hypothetical protein
MHSIEFNAQTHDGIVQIPPQYKDWQNKTVHVVLLEAVEKPDLTKTPQFTAATLKTRNYRFNREQANER